MTTAVYSPATVTGGLIDALEAYDPLFGVKIYDRQRVVRVESDVKTLFTDNSDPPKIHSWQVTLAPVEPITSKRISTPRVGATAAQPGTRGNVQATTMLRFQLEGFYGIDDSNNSAAAFRDIVWGVVQWLNGYGYLDVGARLQSPCNVDLFSTVMFARSILLHYARLSLAFTGRTQP